MPTPADRPVPASTPAPGARAPRRPWTHLVAGVAVAGGAGWLVDVTLLFVLATELGVPSALAAAVGFAASGVINFVINRLVFHGRGGASRGHLARYVVLFLVNLGLVSALVPLLASALHPLFGTEGLRLVAAKLVVTAALLPVNAVAYHRWVFVDRAA